MTEKGQIRIAFPAYKVYIFGVDVTEDVLDIELQYRPGRSPNYCKVSLANPLDKYTCTTADITTLFGTKVKDAIRDALQRARDLGSDERIESILPDSVINEVIDDQTIAAAQSINPEVKRRVILNKVKVRIPNVEQPDIVGKFGGIYIRQLTGEAFKYPFQAEDPIFHANDTIRVWFRDPFSPRKWYHMFCGFLSNFDDSVDENNQKILTIGAEGPAKMLKWARISTNPGIIDINSIKQSELDATERSMYEAGFKNLTLAETLFAIVFGNDPDNEYGGKFAIPLVSADGQPLPHQIRMRGVGNFNFKRSVVVEYGPPENKPVTPTTPTISIPNLNQYQALIDHEVKIDDLEDMMVENAPSDKMEEMIQFRSNIPRYSDGTYDVTYIIDFIGKRPELYPADGGALIILTPASLHQDINKEVLTRDIIQSVPMSTQFKSRLGLIYDIIERIDFVFYESPKGDLICEFPFFDFDPDDFGVDVVPNTRIKYVDKDVRQLITDPNTTRGPFGSSWIVARRDTYNFSKNTTDEKIRTQITSNWYPAQNYDNNVGSTQDMLRPAVVTLRHLVPLYGLRLEQANPKGFIASNAAALLFAQVTLNKMNADARNIGINAIPNIKTWLNRPIYFIPKNCIGTLTGITHSIRWGMGGSMDTRLNINWIRGWDGMVDSNNRPVYTPIGGVPSKPLDYKLLFKLKDTTTPGNVAPPGVPFCLPSESKR